PAGLTLAQIREVLDIRDAGVAPCQHVHDLLEARLGDLDQQIAELQALRHTVAHLRDGAATSDPTNCDATTVCRYLSPHGTGAVWHRTHAQCRTASGERSANGTSVSVAPPALPGSESCHGASTEPQKPHPPAQPSSQPRAGQRSSRYTGGWGTDTVRNHRIRAGTAGNLTNARWRPIQQREGHRRPLPPLPTAR